MDVRETRFPSFKKRGSDVYWEKKRDSLRRMFSKPRKPSRYDTYGQLVSSTSQLNLISATYSVAPRRPLSDDLSSMFSRHLHDSVDQTTGVSKFVLWCVDEIETTGEGLHTDAIYRAAGNQGRVQLIVYTSEENMRQILRSEENVNVLTGALKLFFRRLKMPIIDYRQFNQAFSTDSPTEDLRLLINGLPAVEQNTLSFLMQHLQKVLALQSENKMGIASLGVVFGPTLMRLSPDSVDIASDMKQQNRLFEHLLINYEAIFPPQPGHDATLDLNSLYSVVHKKHAQRQSNSNSSDSEEGRRVVTAATVEIDGGRPRSDSESSGGKMQRVAIAATVGISNTGRRSNTDSSDSERERHLIDAIDEKLKKHQVSQSSDISRPNSQLQNSTASNKNRPAAARYNSSSSDSDENHSKRRVLAIPVRPAPSVQDAQRNYVPNNTTSYKPSSVGNLEENSNKGGSTSRPASRPSALPPAPPARVVHKNPVSHQTSSSDSDKSDNERPKITTKRIVRPVAIPVPPTPPATVSAASAPVVYVTVRNPLRKHKSSSESDTSDSKQRSKTPVTSNRYPLPPALPSTSAPVLVIRKSISRDDTSGSDSDKRKSKQGNKSSVSSNRPATKPTPPALPTTSPPVLVIRKSRSGDDTSGSDSKKRKSKQGNKSSVSSNRPATKPIPPALPSTSPPVLVIRKSRSGDDTSGSDSDKRRSKQGSKSSVSSNRPATKPIPPALPPTSLPVLVIRKSLSGDDTSSSDSEKRTNKKQSKIPVSSNRPASKSIPPPLPSTSPPGISGDDTSSSDSDKRRNKLQNNTSVSSNHPTTKPIPPALPSTPRSILVVRKSHAAGDTSSSESDKNNTEHTTANSKIYFSHKSYEVQSSSKQDSKGNQSINVDYTLKPEPIYSNQDEIDAIRTISSSHNILTGAKSSKYEDVFVNPNQNPAESLYSIDTYRNRQIQRLSAAFDSPTDMDTASAFARQLSDQHFMTSLDSSRRITKLDKTRNVVCEIPTGSDQGHSSITSAAYSTVSHQQKFKQTSYQHQSKVVNATQLSVTSRKERSDSGSSFSSPSGSEDSQRAQVTQLSVRNVPTAI